MENISIPLKRNGTKEKGKARQNIIRYKIFSQIVSEGCIYVCTLCQQAGFRDQVTAVTQMQTMQ